MTGEDLDRLRQRARLSKGVYPRLRQVVDNTRTDSGEDGR